MRFIPRENLQQSFGEAKQAFASEVLFSTNGRFSKFFSRTRLLDTLVGVKWFLSWLLLCVPLYGGPLTVATYNLEFYVDTPTLGVPPKTTEARHIIRDAIKRINPDVIALQEVGSSNAFQELRSALQAEGVAFPYGDYLRSSDTNLHLAFLCKVPIVARRPHTNESFLYQGKRFHVSRGFAEIELQVGRERLTLMAAHLKSKRQTIVADEQGLREEEAALLREHVDDFFQRQPGGKLIVLGDLNDDISSKAVRTILGRGRNKLWDPRPCERNGDTLANPNPQFEPRRILWTHYYGKEESYSRLDYILLSPALRNFVDPGGTYVAAFANWGAASDHRPVIVRLNLPE